MKQLIKLQFIRNYLNAININSPSVAHVLCRCIPSQCPFERDICCFGLIIAHIPPLCKLNPFYEEIVTLRFQALSYLADVCGEDIRCYC